MSLKSVLIDEIDVIENVRTVVGDVGLLSRSIGKFDLLQPILVRPKGNRYELICGQRRYYAAKYAGKTHVDCVIREIKDAEVPFVQLTENMQREDISLEQFCEAIKKLEAQGMNRNDIEGHLRLPRGKIQRKIRGLEDLKACEEKGIPSDDVKKLSTQSRRSIAGRGKKPSLKTPTYYTRGGVTIHEHGSKIVIVCQSDKVRRTIIASVRSIAGKSEQGIYDKPKRGEAE